MKSYLKRLKSITSIDIRWQVADALALDLALNNLVDSEDIQCLHHHNVKAARDVARTLKAVIRNPNAHILTREESQCVSLKRRLEALS